MSEQGIPTSGSGWVDNEYRIDFSGQGQAAATAGGTDFSLSATIRLPN